VTGLRDFVALVVIMATVLFSGVPYAIFLWSFGLVSVDGDTGRFDTYIVVSTVMFVPFLVTMPALKRVLAARNEG
jgi:hypothetical protein